MKSHLGRSLSFLIVLSSLSACTFYGIFSSVDPALGLITAQTAAVIPTEAANSFTLSVVEDYGKEYVVLASDMPYEGTHLWLMDSGLNVLQTLSYTDLGGPGFMGSRVRFDAWHLEPHRMMVGSFLFSLTADRLTNLGWIVPQAPGQFYFAEHSVGDFNVAQIYATGNTLQFFRYADTWLLSSTVSATIGPASAYSLLAVFSDPNAADVAHQAAFFVFRDMAAGTDHFARIPWTDVMGTLAQPLLGTYELFSRPASDAPPEYLGYTGGAFFSFNRAKNNGGGDFVRFDQAGAALPGTLHFEKLPDMRVAYSLTGTHYFTFDSATRVISRRSQWW